MNGSMILTNNNSPSVVAANGVVPLGSAIHGYGKSIRINGNAISIRDVGYYDVLVNLSAAVTAATPLTATIFVDGVTTNSSATATPTEAGAVVNLSIPWVIHSKCCCDTPKQMTVVLDSAATVTDITVEVVRL